MKTRKGIPPIPRTSFPEFPPGTRHGIVVEYARIGNVLGLGGYPELTPAEADVIATDPDAEARIYAGIDSALRVALIYLTDLYDLEVINHPREHALILKAPRSWTQAAHTLATVISAWSAAHPENPSALRLADRPTDGGDLARMAGATNMRDAVARYVEWLRLYADVYEARSAVEVFNALRG